MESKSIIFIRRILYVVIFVAASLPIACAYVMNGGEILLWLARIEELKTGLQSGDINLFVSAELTAAYGGQAYALNSNLWFILPALMRLVGISITSTYRIFMLLLNLITLFSAKYFFETVFKEKNTAAVGVLLYMTCPYQIFISYDKGNLGLICAWMLIPLFFGGLLKLAQGEVRWKNYFLSAIAFAGIGYADVRIWILIIGVSVLTFLWYRRWQLILPLAAGGILFLPGVIYCARYFLKGGMEVWNIPLYKISSEGYQLAQFFTSWTYREDYPGLGLGLFLALAVLIWLSFTEGNLKVMKKYGLWVIIAIVLGFMTTVYFPWDVVQRVGMPLQRLIGILEAPGICFALVCLACSVLGAYGVEVLKKQENIFVRVGFPIMIIIASIGVSVYLCNTLTYTRLPMYLQNVL